MDYTTLAIVKAALGNTLLDDDTVLGQAITTASRAIDRKCTGVLDADATDYFKSESRVDEMLNGMATNDGVVVCYPHKSNVSAVTSLSYRRTYLDTWQVVEDTWLQGIKVEGRPCNLTPGRLQIKISYTGGLGAAVTNLPADLIDVATILTIRFYKEQQSGLQDTIGLAETGIAVYTKAWPVRANQMIQPFIRVVSWRNFG